MLLKFEGVLRLKAGHRLHRLAEDFTMPTTRPLASPPPALRLQMPRASASETSTVGIELVAAIIAVQDDEPVVRVVLGPSTGSTLTHLPSALYSPEQFGSLEDSLRESALRDTGLALGYIEQLQTVAVSAETGLADRTSKPIDTTANMLSIGYLALAHGADIGKDTTEQWQSWYSYLPWEDWRRGKPSVLTRLIEPRLQDWADAGESGVSESADLGRADRVRMAFGIDGAGWDEEKVLDRYDVLHAAGLLTEAQRRSNTASILARSDGGVGLGVAMLGNHRRNLAMAISRLRTKIKSRPVVFELMPERFTLYELQRTVEAILGPHLHKQNFRRLVEHMGLVEPTDDVKNHTGGRPAKLFRFRRSVLWERLHPGVRVRGARV